MTEVISLREEIHRDILNGRYECVVCYEKIHSRTPVWSCGSCFRVIDLKCVKTWYERTKKPDGSFNCPHCRTAQKKTRLSYRCWCKKESLGSKGKLDHALDDAIPPHSCGQTCGAKRDCPHPCPLICHAGPHLPSSTCMHLGPKIRCFCGKHAEQKPCAQTKYGGFSCGQSCGRVNKVCGHKCSRACHALNKQSSEPCHPCEQLVRLTCFCQKLGIKVIPCHELFEKERRNVHSRDHKTISCGEPCGKVMNCGNHYCEHACHHGNRNREFHVCPLTPFPGETCFCGKIPVERKSCLDPKVSCKCPCEKQLPCGHVCQKVCHEGACPPCSETLLDVPCRCERTTQAALCGQIPHNPPLCTRKCGETLSCGRHHCSQECCPFNPVRMHKLTAHRRLLEKRQLGLPTGSRKSASKNERMLSPSTINASSFDVSVKASHHSPSHHHTPVSLGEEINDILNLEEIARLTHTCEKVCGRSLNCKIHTCSLVCHSGSCPPCLSASFEEWVCPCGRTKVLPPIRCGTTLPVCTFQCHRPQSCGHQATHLCHSDELECPPCTKIIKKSCSCGKQMLNGKCSAPTPRCATPCGKMLPCGHSCRRLCCPGINCGPCEVKCEKLFPCGHRHQERCHFPLPCPTECNLKLVAKCPCGTLAVTYECGEDLEVYCNETCVSEIYHPDLLEAFDNDRTWISGVESKIAKFVSEANTQTLWFQPMGSYHRKLVHLLLTHYGIQGESVDYGRMRSVCGRRTEKTRCLKFRLINAPRKRPQVDLILPEQQSDFSEKNQPPKEGLNNLNVGIDDTADTAMILVPHSKPSVEKNFEEDQTEQLKAKLQSKLRSFELLME